MRNFKITEDISVLCEYKKTRNGFKHEATLLINGFEKDKTKITYLNRTWESFEFESVAKKLINKTKELSEEDKIKCLNFFKGDLTDWTGFKTIKLIAGLGEIFSKNQKDKNDWKKRILETGLGNKGFIIPKDWESLTEQEKEKRLNLVIEELNKH